MNGIPVWEWPVRCTVGRTSREVDEQEAGTARTKESDAAILVRGQPEPDHCGDTDSGSLQTAREWTVTHG